MPWWALCVRPRCEPDELSGVGVCCGVLSLVLLSLYLSRRLTPLSAFILFPLPRPPAALRPSTTDSDAELIANLMREEAEGSSGE